jgi:hypothetical protein
MAVNEVPQYVWRIDLHRNPLGCIPTSTKVIILSNCKPTSKPTNPPLNHPSTKQPKMQKNSVTTSFVLTTSTVHINDDGRSTTLILILLPTSILVCTVLVCLLVFRCNSTRRRLIPDGKPCH